ncbi:MAG: hypothetical protein A3J29_19235 [Acidobacteria bacterium RIFCSPLOWO2_12_FULL_67_14b]|nr:MAG: hypothetical protein A3J29_19235 [Acidobacteria bacterium RIFCSPLOWO2_12_FULL_67_14b]
MAMKTDTLFEANLRLIEQRFPDIARRLDGIEHFESSIVWEDGRPADIDLGGSRLYGRPAAQFVRDQIEAYFAAPERFILNQPEGICLKSIVSQRVYHGILATLRAHGITSLLGQPKDVIGYLLIFGLGLGLHLEELIERTGARHVIVIEPVLEFVAHALRAIDWSRIVDGCERRGGSLTLIADGDPEAALGSGMGVIRDHGASLLDGSYLYLHYQTWATREIRSRFKEHTPYQAMAMGFYEDEVLMVANAAVNLMRQPFHLITGDPRPKRREPAFIVASGPSIDDAVDTLRRWQGHAVIFSSGSSLQVLLSHGIVPDYHVELENVPEVVDFLHHMIERNLDRFPRRRFEGMRLIASLTVDPAVPSLFDETYFFFRDSVSSTHAFGTGTRMIYFIAPNVSNTSLALASVLGFHEVYLFGTDCGMRDPARHHSKDTIYFTTNKYRSPTAEPALSPYTYPGNFGGMVYTDLLLNWNRQFLEEAIRIYRLAATNCSDGVVIDGATPRVPESVRLTNPVLDKDAVARQIREASRRFGAGEFLRPFDLGGFVAACERLAVDLADEIERSRAEDVTIEDFQARIGGFLRGRSRDYQGVINMVSGSAGSVPMIAAYYINRIDDAEARKEVFHDFRDDYDRLVRDMCRHARRMFAMVAAGDVDGLIAATKNPYPEDGDDRQDGTRADAGTAGVTPSAPR